VLSASNFEMADITPTQAPTQAPTSTTQIISGLSNTAFWIIVGIAALAVVIGASFYIHRSCCNTSKVEVLPTVEERTVLTAKSDKSSTVAW
jgi:hypothetical protein